MGTEKCEIMRQYSRAIMHMREQINSQRFGLVFGAGISIDFGFPSWWELVKRIAENEMISGSQLIQGIGKKTSISQLLFQNYKSQIVNSIPNGFDEYNKLYSYIQSGWHRIIHDALYKDVPEDILELKKLDPYLKDYLSIIKQTKLTINYNFDDTLQTLLSDSRLPEEREMTRGFRTVWKIDVQLYPQNAVIYHPNGYLPRGFSDKPSDDLIFLEGAFGDQLIDSVSGHYATLSYHFSQNTCLFIGMSLEDSTLKHLLRKNAILHPGHVHYYVHFLHNNEIIKSEKKRAIRDANFEVYNLVTLFLNRKGISTLGQLLNTNDDEVELIADEVDVPTTYRFFLTGSVCVGKTTAVSNFRSLRTHDEWLEKREAGMHKDPDNIQEDSIIRRIDEWVAQQWRRKNFILYQAKRPGIDIVDRCPLDAFAFTLENQWREKAAFTRKIITPQRSKAKLAKGEIIFLIGEPKVMAIRAMKLQKDVTAEQLAYRQTLLRVIYDKDAEGIIELDTREKSIQQIVKEICRIIHIDDYNGCDLQGRLEKIEKGDISPILKKEEGAEN